MKGKNGKKKQSIFARNRIAAFGIRSLPPENGSAGADKFALELYPRLVQEGYAVTVYNRNYKRTNTLETYHGVHRVGLKTVRLAGFDTLIHSMKSTWHIIVHNTADVVHIHNGGNSIWAIPLRLCGKKVFISQDGIDWKRGKWSWYARIFLYCSAFITVHVAHEVIFDNIFAQKYYSNKFKKNFKYIPYGSEVAAPKHSTGILKKLELRPNEYFLFVGRFIPDKGVHYLIKAFNQLTTKMKLVLIGGSPNPSEYEKTLKETKDERIIFPGYIYGESTLELMQHAYLYIQPSDVEGQSPVILTVMGLGTPLLCSNIPENLFVVQDYAVKFSKGNIQSLKEQLEYAILHPKILKTLALSGQTHILKNYSWEKTVYEHIETFFGA
jgi:glycosyltransferase involved in cell wall biosynthesis